MDKGLIAVVGSLEDNPTFPYTPPLRDVAGARAAAVDLGRSLAEADFGLVVYDHRYIEAAVVQGYVASGKAKPGSIEVHYSRQVPDAAEFPEVLTHPAVFTFRPDAGKQWEMCFYRSLANVAGMVLIGGRQSTLVTGLIALTFRIPLLVFGGYGGAASEVWEKQEHDGMADARAHAAMGSRMDAPRIALATQSLAEQRRRRAAEDAARRGMAPAVISLALIVLWLTCLFVGLPVAEAAGRKDASDAVRSAFVFLVLFGPACAGASGATLRGLLGHESSFRTAVLGIAAGAIAGVVYTLGQFFTNDQPYKFILLGVAVMVGLAGGYTFDAVFRKLEEGGIEEMQKRLTTKN